MTLYTLELYLEGGQIATVKTTDFDFGSSNFTLNYNVKYTPAIVYINRSKILAITLINVEEVEDGIPV